MLETLLRRLDMVRLTIMATLVLLGVGCSGLIDDGGTGGLTPAQQKARKLFLEKALPQLSADCNVCHDGSRANIGFMAGASDIAKHDTLVAYTPVVVNIDAPGSSRLLTKGQHEGPPLDGIQTSDILEWIQAEKEAAGDIGGGPDPRLQTPPLTISICESGLPDDPAAPNPNCLVNSIPLDMVGDGIAGAQIRFVAQSVGSGLYFTNFRVVPGAGGALIEHPLVVAYGADDGTRQNCELIDAATNTVACADTIDRFNSVKINIEMAALPEQQLIGGGAGAFVGFRRDDKIGIHFKTASLFVPDGGGGPIGGGCKALDVFKTSARNAFTTAAGGVAACNSCHGGQNNNATSAMNLTEINNADDTIAIQACNEVRTRLDFANFANSSVVLAVAPANMNHPVKYAAQADHNNFQNLLNNPADPVQSWFVQERDRP